MGRGIKVRVIRKKDFFIFFIEDAGTSWRLKNSWRGWVRFTS